jgi:hypothetical protein
MTASSRTLTGHMITTFPFLDLDLLVKYLSWPDMRTYPPAAVWSRASLGQCFDGISRTVFLLSILSILLVPLLAGIARMPRHFMSAALFGTARMAYHNGVFI